MISKTLEFKLPLNFKDGIDSVMDEDLHNLISKLPVSVFTQKINHHPALIYICDNYHRDVFSHFIFRYQELHPDYHHSCSMLLIGEAYEKTDSHCIPRYLFDVACDSHGVDFTASLCCTNTIDPSVFSVILKESYIPPKYKLLSQKIRRIIEKVEKPVDMDVEN